MDQHQLCAGRLLLLLSFVFSSPAVQTHTRRRNRERERKRGPQTGDASTVAADTHALTR
jgi:hypothetical protein